MKSLPTAFAILLAATAHAGDDPFKKPKGPIGLPGPGQIDTSKLPLDTQVSLLRQAVTTLRQENAEQRQQIQTLQQQVKDVASAVSSNAATMNAQINKQSEKLSTISQQVGTVPPHSHKVIVDAPSISCFDGNCQLSPPGALGGSTVGTTPSK